jgi:hypothetical protein
MLNMKALLEPIINEALICGVYNYSVREWLYIFFERTLFEMK